MWQWPTNEIPNCDGQALNDSYQRPNVDTDKRPTTDRSPGDNDQINFRITIETRLQFDKQYK